jgi:hypothetical protein
VVVLAMLSNNAATETSQGSRVLLNNGCEVLHIHGRGVIVEVLPGMPCNAFVSGLQPARQLRL